jgi:hypothetical protein
MSAFGVQYLQVLLGATTQEEFESKVLEIVDRIDYLYRKGILSKSQVDRLIDEIVSGLLDAGFEKSGTALEEYSGLEDLHESLSIDNSKSDELMAMAYPRSKIVAKPRKP